MNPRRLAAVLAAGLVVTAAVTGLAVLRPAAPAPPALPAAPAPSHPSVPPAAVRASTVAAAAVLREWDRRRGRAWAVADVRGLRSLYLPGSRTGQQDRAALAAYAGRGLRVTGLRMQLLAVTVSRRDGARLVLRVTDRMTRAVARGRGGAVVLPRDEPSSWRVSLRRLADGWRVAEIRRARPPARP